MKTLAMILLLQCSILLAASNPSPSPSWNPSPSPSPLLVGCKATTTCGDGSKISCTGNGAKAQCTNGRDKGLNYVSCSDDGINFVISKCTN